jgi:adenosylhomocysteine nucleosidase
LASDRPGAPFGIVVGLRAEARIARRLGMPVAIGGGGPAGAATAARRLIADGVRGLLSFGLCGGLDPALRPGDLIVPAIVLDAGRRHAADPGIAARFGGLTTHVLLGGDAVAGSVAAKHALRAATAAHAIDLESGAVARLALMHNLPFAAIRVVCDPADAALPPAALVALDAGGAIGLLRVARSVLLRPGQIPALLALAGHAAAARRRLARVAVTS